MDEKCRILILFTVLLTLLFYAFSPFSWCIASASLCVAGPFGWVTWEKGWGDATLGQEEWHINAARSFPICQVRFCCSPEVKCSPATDLHLCSWSLADVPRQRSSGSACVPVLITSHLSLSSPHPLPPHPGALLSYQPALLGANLL